MQRIEVTTSNEALSAIVKRVGNGDEVVLTRDGRIVVRMVPATDRPANAPGLRDPEQQAHVQE